MSRILRIEADALLDMLVELRQLRENLESAQARGTNLLDEVRAYKDWLRKEMNYDATDFEQLVEDYKARFKS